MARTIKIDFYRVEMPESAPAQFHEIIEQVADSANDGNRTVSIDKCPVRMQQAEKTDGCWHGDMVRIRMNEGAILTKLSGETHPIDLDDDEGIGEQTAFLYQPTMNILVVQRNRFAVSASKLARYFESMGGLDEPIVLDPIYTQDAIQRLARLTTIRKFTIRLAGPTNATAFKRQAPHFGGMIDLIEAFQSPRIVV
ncbi:MAG: hypothetical protein IID35_08570, partial [Planctomycetes bacterium]|nr:hypothetical protein [Planctomycetota bacterium]